MTFTLSPLDEMAPLFMQLSLIQISTRSTPPLPKFMPKIIMLGRIMRNRLFILELAARAGFILDTLVRHGPAILHIFRGRTTIDGVSEVLDEEQRSMFFHFITAFAICYIALQLLLWQISRRLPSLTQRLFWRVEDLITHAVLMASLAQLMIVRVLVLERPVCRDAVDLGLLSIVVTCIAHSATREICENERLWAKKIVAAITTEEGVGQGQKGPKVEKNGDDMV